MSPFHSGTVANYSSHTASFRVVPCNMTRQEESQQWEKYRKLITFLYRFHGLKKTVSLLENSCDFDAR